MYALSDLFETVSGNYKEQFRCSPSKRQMDNVISHFLRCPTIDRVIPLNLLSSDLFPVWYNWIGCFIFTVRLIIAFFNYSRCHFVFIGLFIYIYIYIYVFYNYKIFSSYIRVKCRIWLTVKSNIKNYYCNFIWLYHSISNWFCS